MNNRLARAGPGIRKRGSRRIGRPAATPGDHPELHSETAFPNGNAGCAPAQTGVETSRRFCGPPQNGSREQPERTVPRLRGAVPGPGHSRPFQLAWAPAFPTPAPWLNARTSAIGLPGCAVVVGSAGGVARRSWTETVLSGGGSVSPRGQDPGGGAGPGVAGVPAYRPPDCPGAPTGVAATASGDRKEPTLHSPEERRREKVSTTHTGRGRLGPPGPSRAIGGAG